MISAPRSLPVLALAHLAVACAQTGVRHAAEDTARPNVLVIITDDQGYGDLAVHGNGKIRTPHLDQLHGESVRFTNFHVDPTCSPTRSALMTGRYSTRTGVWHTIMGRSLLDPSERTLAEMFQEAGYRTGMFGKWHLGDNCPSRPQDQGFEHVVWHHGGGVGQGPDYWDNDYFDDTYEVNGEWRPFAGYCTDVWFDEALEFVEADDERPFFAYLSTNAPHGPFLVDESYSQPYVDAGLGGTMAKFHGMIENIDDNVGALRARLEELGLAENTVLVFMTDNGTAAGDQPTRAELESGRWPGFNAGMRGKKGSEYEGGHRVPFFVHWPAGKLGAPRDIDLLAAHVDVLPTLADLAGAAPAGQRPLDGASLAPVLRGEEHGLAQRTLFVHSQRIEYPRPWRKCAVMTQRWRLINGAELYDVLADPGQATDVAGEHPELVASLRGAYEGWWDSFGSVLDEKVRIRVGDVEDPVALMSHDWHTEDQGTPWHQNHVRSGYLGNGPWALEVAQAGRYEVTLYRWPAHLERAMDMVHATIAMGELTQDLRIEPAATHAAFRVELPEGPVDLLTTLRRPDGKEHGAYFASVRTLQH